MCCNLTVLPQVTCAHRFSLKFPKAFIYTNKVFLLSTLKTLKIKHSLTSGPVSLAAAVQVIKIKNRQDLLKFFILSALPPDGLLVGSILEI